MGALVSRTGTPLLPTRTPADPYRSADATYWNPSGPIWIRWCNLQATQRTHMGALVRPSGSSQGSKPLQRYTNLAPPGRGGPNFHWAGPSGPIRVRWCNLPGLSGPIWGGWCKLLGPQRTRMIHWCNLLGQYQTPYGSAADPYGSAAQPTRAPADPHVSLVPSGAAAQFTVKSSHH